VDPGVRAIDPGVLAQFRAYRASQKGWFVKGLKKER